MSRVVRVAQQDETNISAVYGQSWEYLYGYYRSAEARAAEEPGQDYLTFQESEHSFVFVVCDGISMSYYGDFAAKFLGEGLRDWLCSSDSASWRETGSDSLSAALHEHLCLKAEEASRELGHHVIPSHITGMLKEVLLDKKKLGSASVYACGRIDLPCEAFPQGRLLLAWQGDIRIRLWREDQEIAEFLGDRFRTREQWNSSQGPVGGKPHVYLDSLARWGSHGRLILYTDGLQALDGIKVIGREELQAVMTTEATNPSSDDMSVVQIQWLSTPQSYA